MAIANFNPGFIINGVANDDIPKALEQFVDSDGMSRRASRALVVPSTYPDVPAYPNVNPILGGASVSGGIPEFLPDSVQETGLAPSAWVELGSAQADSRFIGVANPETAPYAQLNADGTTKSQGVYNDYDVKKGEMIGIVRDCIVPVVADGTIKQQDLLELSSNGKFKAQSSPNIATAVAVAYSPAVDGGIFEAYIRKRR